MLSGRSPAVISANIARAFPDLAAAAEISTFTFPTSRLTLGEADAAICTLWTTAYPLLRSRGIGRKFYFVQDWEPLFYPGGTISTAVEATYRFGFHAVCNTPSLAESYQALGDGPIPFLPSVDPDVFHSRGRRSRDPNEPFLLVCYARPYTPRNCFEVIARGLIELKQRYGARIQIVSAGCDWEASPYGLDGVVHNVGLLPYTETGALYRAADAGLVAMATRHPSYLPLELMACGAAVVTNRNPHTGWLLRDGETSLLCEMTQSDIAATVGTLIDNPALRDFIANRGASEIASKYSSWDATCERIFTIIRDAVELGLTPLTTEVSRQ